MLIDITGTVLTPGNMGLDCLGNGLHEEYECCCEECDFALCCFDEKWESKCRQCTVNACPRKE